MFIKFLIIFSFIFSIINADDIKKGKKIYDILCDKKAIATILYDNADELEYQIDDKKYCGKISEKKLKHVVKYLLNKDTLAKKSAIHVPKGSKCPVCGMLTAKYPKWVATIKEEDGKTYYFDGIKDMMKYYFNPTHFHHDKKRFEEISVSDYYTLTPIKAKDSWFVMGSNIYGPMGNELIPFKSKEDAKEFSKEHFGKKIVKFDEITEDLVYSLDQ
jgi:nitrous oxide reductase accessory protein NosL